MTVAAVAAAPPLPRLSARQINAEDSVIWSHITHEASVSNLVKDHEQYCALLGKFWLQLNSDSFSVDPDSTPTQLGAVVFKPRIANVILLDSYSK